METRYSGYLNGESYDVYHYVMCTGEFVFAICEKSSSSCRNPRKFFYLKQMGVEKSCFCQSKNELFWFLFYGLSFLSSTSARNYYPLTWEVTSQSLLHKMQTWLDQFLAPTKTCVPKATTGLDTPCRRPSTAILSWIKTLVASESSCNFAQQYKQHQGGGRSWVGVRQQADQRSMMFSKFQYDCWKFL